MAALQQSDFGASRKTAADLDRIAVEHDGIIGSHGYGHDTNAKDIELEGGWAARWVGTKGMGNYGELVLLPTDPRTRGLWRAGKIRSVMRFGLTEKEARRLVDARIPYRFERQVLEPLGEILADEEKIVAWTNHPGYSRKANRRQWWADYADMTPESACGLSAPREHALACAVRTCAT